MKQILSEEFRRMQKLAGLITESQLNESENLLSLIRDYIDYHYNPQYIKTSSSFVFQ